MKKILNKGNLPQIMQIFAKQVNHAGLSKDNHDTDFFECVNEDEFINSASGKLDESIKFEIVPSLDKQTNRYYLVGFSISESKLIVHSDYMVKLNMYFIEIKEDRFKYWIDIIKQHRVQQQQETEMRRNHGKSRILSK